jgi:hypothetical protein
MFQILARRSSTSRLLKAALCALPLACSGGGADQGHSSPPGAEELQAEVLADWADLHYALVKADVVAPPRAAREYGCVGVVAWEAVAAEVEGGRSLAGQLNSLAAGAVPDPEGRIHAGVALNHACATALRSFHPTRVAQIDALEEEWDAQHAAQASAEVLARSQAHGDAVALAVEEWMASDGSDSTDCTAFGGAIVPHEQGGWIPSPGAAMPGVVPCWGAVRPMAAQVAPACEPAQAPRWSSSPDSVWYAHGLLVRNTGANLSAEEEQIARYWADNAGATGTPPGHWWALAAQLARERDATLAEAARTFAELGVAVCDAFINCWRVKYDTYLERPQSYVTERIDAGWTPLLGTPNFPTYTSGHATQSGAALVVLEARFGAGAFVDETHARLNPELGHAPRAYASFEAAAQEAAVSRLYGGIHFVFDNEDGVGFGRCIAADALSRLAFEE